MHSAMVSLIPKAPVPQFYNVEHWKGGEACIKKNWMEPGDEASTYIECFVLG